MRRKLQGFFLFLAQSTMLIMETTEGAYVFITILIIGMILGIVWINITIFQICKEYNLAVEDLDDALDEIEELYLIIRENGIDI